MIYFDSCALVKLVWAEEHTADLVSWLSAYPDEMYVSSTLAVVELRRTMWRVDPAARAEVDAVLAELTLLPMDAAVVRAAGEFRRPLLRSLDAIHLATATAAMPPAETAHFLTYDRRLWQAAVAEGLSAVAPGASLVAS